MNTLTYITRPAMRLMALLLTVVVAGCGGGAGGGAPILGTGNVTALVPPTVTNVAPLDNSAGVGLTNTIITAQFSEPMAPLTAANFTVACTVVCTKPPAGTVALNAAKTIATFTLTNSPLLPLTTYTATVTGAKSLATGLAVAAPFVWHFTTGATPDTTQPSVTLTVPAAGAVNVATNTAITAVFSEEMNPATIESPLTNFTLTCATCVATSVTGNVSYVVGSRSVVFTPTAPALLEAGKTYTAAISAAATDQAGNTLTGGAVPNPWTFTTTAAPTPDTTAPVVSSTNPVNGAVNVDVNQPISATFNEPMKATTIVSTGTFTLTGPGVTPVIGTIIYDVLNNIATFTPTNPAPLAFGTTYTALISNAATDVAGNALVVPPVGGLPVPNSWAFTTQAAPAVPPPALAINLRSAASFGIASRAGLTTTGVTRINGDVALYPSATCTDATGNAGASQTCLVKTYVSPTGMTVNGSIYFAGDPYDNGASANAATSDLVLAWNEGQNKVDTQAGVLVGQLGGPGPTGKTLFAGVYHEAALGLAAGFVATLDAQNNPNAIFIFKVDSSFVDSGTLLLPTQIKLINGAQARNVWFVTGLDITIGSGTTWNGNILAGRTATVLDGSTVNGRVLAGASGAGAVTLTGAATPSLTTITVPPN